MEVPEDHHVDEAAQHFSRLSRKNRSPVGANAPGLGRHVIDSSGPPPRVGVTARGSAASAPGLCRQDSSWRIMVKDD
eukprot:NODE_5608_length_569_cov_6.447471.p2 GENE.NODE_5608_length_569_cov_6.447471~~NODE_5608_length_569_cov_6.447471.p2  ORF type:complete len:77 (-),score=3.37 NODE_5608_length_569_cov_6.447471:145-375(-)